MDESRYHLLGGEILDEERMSGIKNEVLSGMTLETEAEIVTEHHTASENEANVESSAEYDSIEVNDEQIVYWTKSGSVWHTKKDCYHLKNKEFISGTIEEAREANKERLCSNCGK